MIVRPLYIIWKYSIKCKYLARKFHLHLKILPKLIFSKWKLKFCMIDPIINIRVPITTSRMKKLHKKAQPKASFSEINNIIEGILILCIYNPLQWKYIKYSICLYINGEKIR